MMLSKVSGKRKAKASAKAKREASAKAKRKEKSKDKSEQGNIRHVEHEMLLLHRKGVAQVPDMAS